MDSAKHFDDTEGVLGLPPQEKRYYSIGEVAELLSVKASQIRFWEREFPQLTPHRTRGGSRRYTKADLELLAVIRRLVHVQGMKIRGAQQVLTQKKRAQKEHQKHLNALYKAKAFFTELRNAIP